MSALPIALLTVEEFAAATRRAPSSVRAGLRRGEVPAVKIGRRWFVRHSDVERLFDAAAVSHPRRHPRHGRTAG